MKKILLGINSLHIGGIQTALINLLQNLDYTKYDVTVQLFHYEEEYRGFLPPEVKIRKASFPLGIANNTMKEAKKKGTAIYVLRAAMAVICKIIGANRFYSLLFRGIHDDTFYDEAISFTNNGNIKTLYFGMNQYILNCVEARKKSTWLHVDFEGMKLNDSYNISEYRRFDRVITVSEAAKDIFLKYVPEMSAKTHVVYNVINPEKLKEQGNDRVIGFETFAQDRLKIVTICRLDENKNVTACLEVAQRLKDRKIPFQWIIVGDGTERNTLAERASEKRLDENVTFVGYQRNPYPYIMDADIAVSTSISESYGMSIAESIALHVPAIAFYYPALQEVIKNGENGFIIGQGCTEDMANKIIALYESGELVEMKKRCCNLISANDAISQFDRVFDGEEA